MSEDLKSPVNVISLEERKRQREQEQKQREQSVNSDHVRPDEESVDGGKIGECAEKVNDCLAALIKEAACDVRGADKDGPQALLKLTRRRSEIRTVAGDEWQSLQEAVNAFPVALGSVMVCVEGGMASVANIPELQAHADAVVKSAQALAVKLASGNQDFSMNSISGRANEFSVACNAFIGAVLSARAR